MINICGMFWTLIMLSKVSNYDFNYIFHYKQMKTHGWLYSFLFQNLKKIFNQ